MLITSVVLRGDRRRHDVIKFFSNSLKKSSDIKQKIDFISILHINTFLKNMLAKKSKDENKLLE